MQTPYWRALLSTGKTLSKYQSVWDQLISRKRELDWTLDVVATGDIFKIKELHLVCPRFQVVALDILEPGTAFQFYRQSKGVDMSTGRGMSSVEAQIIGRVYDKEHGLSQGYIWDRIQGLIQFDEASVYDFPSWRPGLIAPGELALAVLGLRL